ncbi:hypothetical protein RHS04_05090 [Rhizoctonia solani]|nr:hypothetical protein RHS04_05090 [Rhizoctonia solani]
MSTNMLMPIISTAPENPRVEGDDSESADDWVFRCLAFYAQPDFLPPPRHGNSWTAHIFQASTRSNCKNWRYLQFSFCMDPKTRVTTCTLSHTMVPTVPGNAVADIKFWVTSSYRFNPHTRLLYREEYTHRHLMEHLREPRGQRLIWGGNLSFKQGLVSMFVNLRLIAPGSLQELDAKLSESYISYNVPLPRVEESNEPVPQQPE